MNRSAWIPLADIAENLPQRVRGSGTDEANGSASGKPLPPGSLEHGPETERNTGSLPGGETDPPPQSQGQQLQTTRLSGVGTDNDLIVSAKPQEDHQPSPKPGSRDGMVSEKDVSRERGTGLELRSLTARDNHAQ